MKREFIFLGPPACGKGTQTEKLAKHLGFPHIDTGSLLRAEIASGSENGMIAKERIDKGQLVPVWLVGEIIKTRLSQEDCKNGFILDGFPRSLEQAEMLEEIRKHIDGNDEVDFRATYFDIHMDILISRIVNRRSCSKCGEIFNLKSKAPQKENICDICGETAPLIDYYKEKGSLYSLDADGTIDEVWERLLKVVE